MRARMDAADVAELEKRLKESGPEHARHQSSTDSWEEMAASKTQAAWADADQIVKKRVAEEVLLHEYPNPHPTPIPNPYPQPLALSLPLPLPLPYP